MRRLSARERQTGTIRAHDMSAGRSRDFASPKASDLVFAALIGGLAGAALGARSNRVGAASSTIGGACYWWLPRPSSRPRRGMEIRHCGTGSCRPEHWWLLLVGWRARRPAPDQPRLASERACSRGFWGTSPEGRPRAAGRCRGWAGIGGARTQAIAGRGGDDHAGALPDVVVGGFPGAG